jgi:hypothetical protein
MRHWLSAAAVVALAACGRAPNGVGEPLADSGVPPPLADAGICARAGLDAGLCLVDADCSLAFYCDFTVTHCSIDGGRPIGSLVAGSCLPRCSPDGTTGIFCHSGEDCGGTQAECSSTTSSTYDNNYDFCTLTQPCNQGVCSFQPCTGAGWIFPCPSSDCTLATVPHSCDSVCVCPGLTCGADGGLSGG